MRREDSSVANHSHHFHFGDDSCNLTTVGDPYDTIMTWKCVCPVLLVLGTATGVLNILILTRKNSRQCSSALYLLTLAIADLTVLHTGLLRQWLSYGFDLDIRLEHDFVCKSTVFVVYLALQMSSWTLVLVTVERMIIVQFPHRAKYLCTRKRALVTVLTTFCVLFLMNIHILINVGRRMETIHNTSTPVRVCGILNYGDGKFWKDYIVWLDLVVFCGLPSLILVSANTAIIVKILIRQRKRRILVPAQSARINRRQSGPENSQKTWASMIALLVLLDAWFIVCTVPVCVVFVLVINGCAVFGSEHEYNTVWVIVNILMYSNNTFNFFLYCFSGSRFRKELLDLFWKCKCHRRPSLTVTCGTQDSRPTK